MQLVSRGTAAFGAVKKKLLHLAAEPLIDVTPLPINIAIDKEKMHVIFGRSHLYPASAGRTLSTYIDNQNAIVIKVSTVSD